jgi:hypothetical protein
LPQESFEDAMQTIDFLLSHRKFISHVTFNTYYLTPGNYVYRNPAKYGIEYEDRFDLPFRFFIPFKNKNGLGADWADQLEKIYWSLMNKNEDEKHKTISGSCGNLSEGYAELSLNNETCRLRFLRDAQTESYTFIQKEDGGVPKHEPVCNAA